MAASLREFMRVDDARHREDNLERFAITLSVMQTASSLERIALELAKDDDDAYWLGTMGSGQSGMVLSRPLSLDYKPVTRVENFCATG